MTYRRVWTTGAVLLLAALILAACGGGAAVEPGSPAAAVQNFLDAYASFDEAGMLDWVCADAQDLVSFYSGLFDDIQAVADSTGSEFAIDISQVTLSSETGPNDEALVRVEGQLSMTAAGERQALPPLGEVFGGTGDTEVLYMVEEGGGWKLCTPPPAGEAQG